MEKPTAAAVVVVSGRAFSALLMHVCPGSGRIVWQMEVWKCGSMKVCKFEQSVSRWSRRQQRLLLAAAECGCEQKVRLQRNDARVILGPRAGRRLIRTLVQAWWPTLMAVTLRDLRLLVLSSSNTSRILHQP
jgi:hypothetical protein